MEDDRAVPDTAMFRKVSYRGHPAAKGSGRTAAEDAVPAGADEGGDDQQDDAPEDRSADQDDDSDHGDDHREDPEQVRGHPKYLRFGPPGIERTAASPAQTSDRPTPRSPVSGDAARRCPAWNPGMDGD